MNERIRQLRKYLQLNQTEFGARIGVKQTSVAGYETGARIPLDAVISAICREFHVSEKWLRTGEGEMFVQLTRDEEIAKFIGEVYFGGPTFKRRFISALSRLDEEGWMMIEKMAKSLVEEAEKDQKKTDP